jgi:hypothetical protein
MLDAMATNWKDEPEEHDYPAAADYLALLAPAEAVEATVAALRNAPLMHKKAKDLMRASALALLPPDNPHVAKDLKKVKAGDKLSPVLTVRGNVRTGQALTIADGYHRICASYHLDENEDIPCRLVDLAGG